MLILGIKGLKVLNTKACMNLKLELIPSLPGEPSLYLLVLQTSFLNSGKVRNTLELKKKIIHNTMLMTAISHHRQTSSLASQINVLSKLQLSSRYTSSLSQMSLQSFKL